jgi:hypothetical protein
MPCYQSTNLPSGVTTTGRTSYRTEADCLNACKEGACCEGTTCSVKPQCQCQGAGKVFKGVGTVCASQYGACCEDTSGGPSCSIKNSCECVGVGKSFKGIGTTCTGSCSQCLGGASNCFCYCTSQGGKVPRFINARVQFTATGPAGSGCDLTVDQNVTLTFASSSYLDGPSGGSSLNCYYWLFTSPSLTVTANSILNSQGKEVILMTATQKFCNTIGSWGDTLQSFVDRTTDSSGLCYRRHVGATYSSTEPSSGLASLTITILGFQE